MTDTSTDPERRDSPVEEAFELVGRVWSSQLLYTAIELGIFERLADGPTTADEVARDLSLDADKTYRLLRALDCYDVVDESPQRRFTLAPVGECFLADHPDSVRAHLRFARSPEYVSAMLHLSDIVREGDPNGFVREFDCGLYEYAEEHPAFGNTVSAFMTARLRRETDEVLDALDVADFEQCSHLCDVGGGHGYLLARLLETHPHLQGTVLDLPGVVAESDRHAAPEVGVTDRCRYVAGDMFEDVPAADRYLLKEVLHNWGDEECVEILSTVHDDAPDDGRVFVVEAIVPGPEIDHFSKQLDMPMMVLLGGRERTEREYVSLLNQAGWEHVETYETSSERASVLSALKA
jgi:hypothetical protein